MAVVAKVIFNALRQLWEYTDPRTVDYPLVDNATNTILIIFSYIYFVQSWGPKLMQNRTPFDLKNVMIVYNIIQIIWCAYIFLGVEFLAPKLSRFTDFKLGKLLSVFILIEDYIVTQGLTHMTMTFSYICEPLDHSDNQYVMDAVIKYCYLYALVKVVDLLDTVFMVLRKNTHQISFLHVYHHAGMVLYGFAGMKYHPGGTPIFIGYINSFVHCIMYSYYLGAAVNPKFFKTNHCKKYLTILQIVQFALNIILLAIPVVQPSCKVLRSLHILLIFQNTFMLHMFWDFYQKAYIQRPKRKLKQ